jgi:signal transduction histidine kinase
MTLLKLRGSLRLRLLLGTLFWIVASVLGAGWGLGSLFQQHVQAQFQAELTSQLDQLTAQLLLDANQKPSLRQSLSDPRLSRPYSGHYWQIDRITQGGQALDAAAEPLRSRSLWDHVLKLPLPSHLGGDLQYSQIAGPQGEMLTVVARSVQLEADAGQASASFRLMSAADETLMREPVARFRGTMWLTLAALATGLVIAAVVQVWVGLAPLKTLRLALGKVRNAQTQRLEGEFPLEVMPLIDDFNKVLAQNAEVVERSRTHAGNLAHALKTPLSVMANAAQAEPQAPWAQLVNEQVELARRQVNYHLARAQAAAASQMAASRTAVLPVVEGLVRVMQRIHVERAIDIRLENLASLPAFRGEAQDLQEMLGNLLDNACKWAHQQVLVDACSERSTLVITLDDDGPGLALEQRARVLQRGVRADEQVPGSGLGLAIVDDLARLYGGTLALTDSPLGGLRVVLTLPSV